jgi:hypothetical protein
LDIVLILFTDDTEERAACDEKAKQKQKQLCSRQQQEEENGFECKLTIHLYGDFGHTLLFLALEVESEEEYLNDDNQEPANAMVSKSNSPPTSLLSTHSLSLRTWYL